MYREGDLFTYTFVPKAVSIINDAHSPTVNQIQDSCGQSGDMVWETAVDLSSIMIPFDGKSNANIFHEDKNNVNDDGIILPINTNDVVIVSITCPFKDRKDDIKNVAIMKRNLTTFYHRLKCFWGCDEHK